MQLLEKTLKTESRLANDCSQRADNVISQQIPPPPILIYRSATAMVFAPAPFIPLEKEDVYCYKLFLRNASGNNVKVRLSDERFPGTGSEVSFYENRHCFLVIIANSFDLLISQSSSILIFNFLMSF